MVLQKFSQFPLKNFLKRCLYKIIRQTQISILNISQQKNNTCSRATMMALEQLCYFFIVNFKQVSVKKSCWSQKKSGYMNIYTSPKKACLALKKLLVLTASIPSRVNILVPLSSMTLIWRNFFGNVSSIQSWQSKLTEDCETQSFSPRFSTEYSSSPSAHRLAHINDINMVFHGLFATMRPTLRKKKNKNTCHEVN